MGCFIMLESYAIKFLGEIFYQENVHIMAKTEI